MKSAKYYKYANKYLDCLNEFYDEYKNSIDNYLLDKEYDLMTNILDDLTYDNYVSWNIHFKKNEYRKHIIYKTNKKYWKVLSKMYKKMLKQYNKLGA